MRTTCLGCRVEQYLADCLSRESSPRVSELADLLGLSRVTLNRRFKSQHGSTLAVYLKRRQLEHAQYLLGGTNLSTTKIGYRSGFGTRRTFYRSFRRMERNTPAAWRSLSK